jgi:hypothetical protein
LCGSWISIGSLGYREDTCQSREPTCSSSGVGIGDGAVCVGNANVPAAPTPVGGDAAAAHGAASIAAITGPAPPPLGGRGNGVQEFRGLMYTPFQGFRLQGF